MSTPNQTAVGLDTRPTPADIAARSLLGLVHKEAVDVLGEPDASTVPHENTVPIPARPIAAAKGGAP